MKNITQADFIDLLMKEVDRIYTQRDEAKQARNTLFEKEMFGHQMGLLYVIDQLKAVYTITK